MYFSERKTSMKTKRLVVKTHHIVLALLEHGSNEKAAAALGIDATTVWRWSKKPEVQEQLRKARAEAFSAGIGRLAFLTTLAVDTILEIISDKKAPASVRLRAAESVLCRADTVVLEELQADVEALKQAAKRRV